MIYKNIFILFFLIAFCGLIKAVDLESKKTFERLRVLFDHSTRPCCAL